MADRKMFPDSVTELPAETGVTKNGLIVNKAKADTRNHKMDLLFSLEVPAKDDLEKRRRCRRSRSCPTSLQLAKRPTSRR